MVAAVAPYVDTSISKTVNVPADYPTRTSRTSTPWPEERPQGAGDLSTQQRAGRGAQRRAGRPAGTAQAGDRSQSTLRVERLPKPVLASLRWPSRPELPGQSGLVHDDPPPAWRLRALRRRAAGRGAGGRSVRPHLALRGLGHGAEQPRGLGAMAKTLSMDLRANDAAWLRLKLDALATVAEERSFEMPHAAARRAAAVPAWSRRPRRRAARRRCWTRCSPARAAYRHRRHAGLGGGRRQPRHRRAVHADAQGGQPAHADGGSVTRPCAMGFSGNYPRAFDGLARLLSLDMRVLDPGWIG
ncbi:hypothetical protein Ddc_18802 [Ditylenchus destructor]|nr:hypothetical protein Ddc_18802 [Ditylenchus destructor]